MPSEMRSLEKSLDETLNIRERLASRNRSVKLSGRLTNMIIGGANLSLA